MDALERRRHQLVMTVRFPDCSNGQLDSADHKSHMAYSSWTGKCPSTHPQLVPAITMFVEYPTRGGPQTTVASGGLYSGHADFFNVWNSSTLKSRVANCINRGVACRPDGSVEP